MTFRQQWQCCFKYVMALCKVLSRHIQGFHRFNSLPSITLNSLRTILIPQEGHLLMRQSRLQNNGPFEDIKEEGMLYQHIGFALSLWQYPVNYTLTHGRPHALTHSLSYTHRILFNSKVNIALPLRPSSESLLSLKNKTCFA